MNKLHILGGGLSGLSCAFHFKGESVIYESKSMLGGTASSIHWNGFTYDYGPHVSFTNDQYVKNLFANAIDNEYFTHKVLNANYFKGHWIRHPAICNLCDFPPEINRECLISFLESKQPQENNPITSYQDWCQLAQGKYFADNFTKVYTEKFWTVKPEEMTSDWAGERVARPSIRSVVNGSLGLQEDSGYYFTEFRYPTHGGYGGYSNFWKPAQDRIEFLLDHEAINIDLEKQEIYFKNGKKIKYEPPLISSIPLPDLIRICSNVPNNVQEAVSKLKCTSIALVNIALNTPFAFPYHWFYVYDENILATRVTIYSNISHFNAPKGCTALQVEIPYSSSRPLYNLDIVSQVINQLDSCNLINKADILNAWQINLKYGYVIYDFNRAKCLTIIHEWMRHNGIEPTGRFGLWQYLWSDQAVKSGKQIISSFFE